MAEAQQPFLYSREHIDALERQLSTRRFATYVKAAGFRTDLAFELYLYNARLAKAFLFPLHVMEIVLRNAIDEVFSGKFGTDWHVDARLRQLLTPESQATLSKAVSRATRVAGTASKDDVVSRLTFDFWSNLFRPHYDRPIWQTAMKQLLPNASTMTRARFKPLVMGINQLRNRIAHHEPIFALDVSNQYRDILTAVGYRSAVACHWLQNHATVNRTMRTRPLPGATQRLPRPFKE
ncbi:Abi family protein [Pseudomonas japonica]|uniref:Abi-like protein n=1 Tax=Pseudomonas japonica TaxID=256466 RepID=A0A239FQB9_9PSED|nr:Abi family protein [Pseudomonas japonica]SNS58985.1 Abi-like protein [Pseudomonas japonica]